MCFWFYFLVWLKKQDPWWKHCVKKQKEADGDISDLVLFFEGCVPSFLKLSDSKSVLVSTFCFGLLVWQKGKISDHPQMSINYISQSSKTCFFPGIGNTILGKVTKPYSTRFPFCLETSSFQVALAADSSAESME